MMPLIGFHPSFEGKLRTYPAAIATEKFNGLGVLALFESVFASSCSKKLPRFRIHGHPLKMRTAHYFQGFPGTPLHFRHFSILLTGGYAPASGQFAIRVVMVVAFENGNIQLAPMVT